MAQPPSMDLSIHAVALLNICDYATRLNEEVPQFVGALFGQVHEREIVVNHTFELTMQDSQLDMPLLAQRVELFEGVNPNQRLIGWFAVGASIPEPWMSAIHEQVASVVESPVIGLFDVPFKPQLGLLPFKFFDSSFEELVVQMRVDETEQIALQDVLSASSRRNTLYSQISKETRAVLLLHRHLSQLKEILATGDDRQKSEAVSTIQQLCRDHNFGEATQFREVEQEVLDMLCVGLIIRGDPLVSALM